MKERINIYPLIEAERILSSAFHLTKGYGYINDAQVQIQHKMLLLNTRINDLFYENMTVSEFIGDKPPKNPLYAPEDVKAVITWMKSATSEILRLIMENPSLYPNQVRTNLVSFLGKLDTIEIQ